MLGFPSIPDLLTARDELAYGDRRKTLLFEPLSLGSDWKRWRSTLPDPLEDAGNPTPMPAEHEPWELPKPYVAPVKPGRNDPWSCGSGRKFKKCCGG